MTSFLSETQSRQRASLRNALGATLGKALDDEDTTEILVNADGRVWFDTLSSGLKLAQERFTARETAKTISTIAGLLDQLIDAKRPILEGELPFDGSRIEGVLPPVSKAPVLAIRKRANRIYPLSTYLQPPPADALAIAVSDAPPQGAFADTLDWAIRSRKNILVVGGTNSAKTSLLNSLFERVIQLGSASERFFIIEDTFELQCPAENRVNLQTSETITLSDLVRVALRMRPDRIVIGEVRGAEALPMLRAWNTGHDGGLATVHANSAHESLFRLEELCQEAGAPANPSLIARTIDLVVFLRRIGSSVRVITEMLHVDGYDGHDYQCRTVRNDALRAS